MQPKDIVFFVMNEVENIYFRWLQEKKTDRRILMSRLPRAAGPRLPLFLKTWQQTKEECSGKRLMQWSVGKFEDFETHFRIK
jgi:hypothetical protein